MTLHENTNTQKSLEQKVASAQTQLYYSSTPSAAALQRINQRNELEFYRRLAISNNTDSVEIIERRFAPKTPVSSYTSPLSQMCREKDFSGAQSFASPSTQPADDFALPPIHPVASQNHAHSAVEPQQLAVAGLMQLHQLEPAPATLSSEEALKIYEQAHQKQVYLSRTSLSRTSLFQTPQQQPDTSNALFRPKVLQGVIVSSEPKSDLTVDAGPATKKSRYPAILSPQDNTSTPPQDQLPHIPPNFSSQLPQRPTAASQIQNQTLHYQAEQPNTTTPATTAPKASSLPHIQAHGALSGILSFSSELTDPTILAPRAHRASSEARSTAPTP